MALILVMLGGALGAVSRYLLSIWFKSMSIKSILPLPILLVNGLGSMLLGGLVGLSIQEQGFILLTDKPSMLLISVGFLGALTTFSTFSLEAFQLWQQGKRNACVLYICLTLAITLLGFNITLFFSSKLN